MAKNNQKKNQRNSILKSQKNKMVGHMNQNNIRKNNMNYTNINKNRGK